MRSKALWFLAAVSLACGSGCGSNSVYPVKGVVTFEGHPMKGGGSISFMPVGDRPGKAAGGAIREDGTYELMTYKPGDGSMPGEFRVVISQTTEREAEPTHDGEKAGRSVAAVGKTDRISPLYADPKRTPLTTKVEKWPNELNFDLKRDVGTAPAQGGAMIRVLDRNTTAWLRRPIVLPRAD